MKISYLIPVVALVIAFQSCQERSGKTSQDTKDSLVIKQMDTLQVNSINDIISASQDSLVSLAGKGKTWRLWKRLHKDCQKNELSGDMIYFGVSNSAGIGTIMMETEKGDLLVDFPFLKDKLTDNEKELVILPSNSGSCDFAKKTTVNVDFMAQSNFSANSNADLNTVITSTKDVTASIDSWQRNHITTGGLAETLKKSTNPYLVSYKERLKGTNKYIIVEEIAINGFSAIIKTATTINAGLKAQLEKGIVQNVGQTAAKVSFSYVDETTIKMSTVGTFNVFCKLVEAKYVN